MTAFDAVRFRVKPGREQEFLDAHKKIRADWPGLEHVNNHQDRGADLLHHRRMERHGGARQSAAEYDRDAR
jgi:hypothetical protein